MKFAPLQLNRPAPEVARRLLGCLLEREIDGVTLRVRLTEVEAYDEDDPASHSFRGPTPRTEVMFGPAGYLYVYLSYGVHWCCNVVVGEPGHGAAVLLRGAAPVTGEAYMTELRQGHGGKELLNGPGKLCQALTIDYGFNGHDLTQIPLKLIPQPAISDKDIKATPRIGISRAQDKFLRYVLMEKPTA